MANNYIVINGIKHVLIDNYEHCSKCSLGNICNYCNGFFCNDLFDSPNSHFEIMKDEQNSPH